jgi:hypothetical protein
MASYSFYIDESLLFLFSSWKEEDTLYISYNQPIFYLHRETRRLSLTATYTIEVLHPGLINASTIHPILDSVSRKKTIQTLELKNDIVSASPSR